MELTCRNDEYYWNRYPVFFLKYGIFTVFHPQIAQNAIVFRNMYLQYPVYQRAEIQFARLDLVSCDWSTDLIWEYLSRFADFSCCRLNGWKREVNPKVR